VQFAVSLLQEGGEHSQRCGPLFDATFQPQRRRLLELLVAAGYEVPSVFRPSK
jgi:hypothetical protein